MCPIKCHLEILTPKLLVLGYEPLRSDEKCEKLSYIGLRLYKALGIILCSCSMYRQEKMYIYDLEEVAHWTSTLLALDLELLNAQHCEK